MLLAACAALGAVPVLGADKEASSGSEARYQRDVAACRTVAQGADPAACLREAGAVRDSKGVSRVDPDPERLVRNALKRCEPLPEPERSECVAHIHGNGSTSGSVAGGGVLRELVTPKPAAPIASSAASTAPPTAK
ncbi:hypothetical protein [Hydrogenophaga sp.]|uniref:hypothetical protein n=1 Tax=Hydrogenophaga sp. TaxID=1904254 RepID=UPI0025C20812|nr:hypothetical protein [Hydrogenophaga sp.]